MGILNWARHKLHKIPSVNPSVLEDIAVGIEIEGITHVGWFKAKEFNLEGDTERSRRFAIYKKVDALVKSRNDLVFNGTRDGDLYEVNTRNLYSATRLKKELKGILSVLSLHLKADPTAGIHLSVNEQQGLIGQNLDKFFLFVLNQEEFIFKISGRNISKYNFTTPLVSHNTTDKFKDIISRLRKLNAMGYSEHSYQSFSFNRKFQGRVEIRWFNSSFKLYEVRAFVELIDCIFNYVNYNSNYTNIEYFFNYISCNSKRYPNLIKLIKKRKLI